MREFANRLNHRLLINRPLIWETKIMLILPYLVGSYALILVLCWLNGVDLQDLSRDSGGVVVETLPIFLGIINLVVFGFWIHRSSQYRIESSYGRSPKRAEQVRFCIFFAGTFLLLLAPFIPVMVHEYRVDALVTDHQLQQDVQALNEANIYFPTAIADQPNFQDNIYASAYPPAEYEGYGSYDFQSFSNEYEMAREAVDSRNSGVEYYKSRVEKALDDPSAEQKIARYLKIADRYSPAQVSRTATPSRVFDAFRSRSTQFGSLIPKKELRTRIAYLNREKQSYESQHGSGFQLLAIFSASFFISMLVQIGKHIGLRQFILAVLFNIGLQMGTGVLVVLFGIASPGFYNLSLFTPILALIFVLVQVLSIHSLKAQSTSKTVSLSTVQVYSPFIPLYLFALISGSPQSFLVTTLLALVGCGLYVAFFLPVFRSLHLKLQALPKA